MDKYQSFQHFLTYSYIFPELLSQNKYDSFLELG